MRARTLIPLTLVLTALSVSAAAAPEPPGKPELEKARPARPRFEEPWQKRSPTLPPARVDRTYADRGPSGAIVFRLHRAVDQYVLLARRLEPKEERKLLAQGFRQVDRLEAVRHRTIFEHEAYVGYGVGEGGPSDEALRRLEGRAVKARFRAYRSTATPVLVELTSAEPATLRK